VRVPHGEGNCCKEEVDLPRTEVAALDPGDETERRIGELLPGAALDRRPRRPPFIFGGGGQHDHQEDGEEEAGASEHERCSFFYVSTFPSARCNYSGAQRCSPSPWCRTRTRDD